jgi:hypothetical protein
MVVRCAAAVGLTHLNHSPGLGIESGAWGDGQMRITVELRTGHSHHDDYIARLTGQSAVLSGDGWSVPVQVAAVTMGTSEEEPQEPEGSPFGPGVILGEGTATWAAVIRTARGEIRLASSFLPYVTAAELLRAGLDETLRRIEQAG